MTSRSQRGGMAGDTRGDGIGGDDCIVSWDWARTKGLFSSDSRSVLECGDSFAALGSLPGFAGPGAFRSALEEDKDQRAANESPHSRTASAAPSMPRRDALICRDALSRMTSVSAHYRQDEGCHVVP